MCTACAWTVAVLLFRFLKVAGTVWSCGFPRSASVAFRWKTWDLVRSFWLAPAKNRWKLWKFREKVFSRHHVTRAKQSSYDSYTKCLKIWLKIIDNCYLPANRDVGRPENVPLRCVLFWANFLMSAQMFKLVGNWLLQHRLYTCQKPVITFMFKLLWCCVLWKCIVLPVPLKSSSFWSLQTWVVPVWVSFIMYSVYYYCLQLISTQNLKYSNLRSHVKSCFSDSDRFSACKHSRTPWHAQRRDVLVSVWQCDGVTMLWHCEVCNTIKKTRCPQRRLLISFEQFWTWPSGR